MLLELFFFYSSILTIIICITFSTQFNKKKKVKNTGVFGDFILDALHNHIKSNRKQLKDVFKERRRKKTNREKVALCVICF